MKLSIYYNRSAPAHNSQLYLDDSKQTFYYNRSAPAHNSQRLMFLYAMVLNYNRSAPAHNSQPNRDGILVHYITIGLHLPTIHNSGEEFERIPELQSVCTCPQFTTISGWSSSCWSLQSVCTCPQFTTVMVVRAIE